MGRRWARRVMPTIVSGWDLGRQTTSHTDRKTLCCDL